MQLNFRGAKNSFRKFAKNSGWSNIPVIRFFVEYFTDPWIRWQTKAMFLLWIATMISGFAASCWALLVLPTTFVHFVLASAFAVGCATIFWVSVHNAYMDRKLREEKTSIMELYEL